MFETKHFSLSAQDLAPYALFADAEIAEYHIKDVLDIHPAEQATQRPRREPQLLCHDFLSSLPRRLLRIPQGPDGFLQMRPLARAGHQRCFHRKEVLREA
jgi:hypothetical protein